MEQATLSAEPLKKRPTFLTVLCILTFVCVGLELAGSLMQIPDTFIKTTQEQIDEQSLKLERAEQMMPGITDRVTDMILEMAPYKIPNWTIAFAGNLLTLFAAILMWKQKKIGFHLYVIAELVPFIVSVLFLKLMKAMTVCSALLDQEWKAWAPPSLLLFLFSILLSLACMLPT